MDYKYNNNARISPMEEDIALRLELRDIKFCREVIFPGCVNPKTGCELRYDFYLPDYNVLIEYDGLDFHKDRETRERDKIKNDFAAEHAITLIRIQGAETVRQLFNGKLGVWFTDDFKLVEKPHKEKRGQSADIDPEFLRLLVIEMQDLKQRDKQKFLEEAAIIRRESHPLYMALRPILFPVREASSIRNSERRKKQKEKKFKHYRNR